MRKCDLCSNYTNDCKDVEPTYREPRLAGRHYPVVCGMCRRNNSGLRVVKTEFTSVKWILRLVSVAAIIALFVVDGQRTADEERPVLTIILMGVTCLVWMAGSIANKVCFEARRRGKEVRGSTVGLMESMEQTRNAAHAWEQPGAPDRQIRRTTPTREFIDSNGVRHRVLDAGDSVIDIATPGVQTFRPLGLSLSDEHLQEALRLSQESLLMNPRTGRSAQVETLPGPGMKPRPGSPKPQAPHEHQEGPNQALESALDKLEL